MVTRPALLVLSGVVLALSASSCERESVSGRDRPMPESYPVLEEASGLVKADIITGATVIVETIATPKKVYEEWVFNQRETGGSVLRAQVQEWIRREKGQILETQLVNLKTHSQAVAESALIHPIPSSIGTTKSDDSDSSAIVLLGDIEKRRLGSSLKVSLRPGESGSDFSLALVRSQSHHVGQSDLDPIPLLPKVAESSITTSIQLNDGEYRLIESRPPALEETTRLDDPVILTFLRADAARVTAATSVSKSKTKS